MMKQHKKIGEKERKHKFKFKKKKKKRETKKRVNGGMPTGTQSM
jgi:hypothetical protein